jgi:D-alanine transaminase
MPNIAVVNGKFMPLSGARVSVEDRGFLFGDGIYELIRSHAGRLFGLDEHLRRMKRSAEALRLDLRHSDKEWKRLIVKALERSGIPDAKIYIEVTRGAAPRSHTFPKGTASTAVMTVRRFEPVPQKHRTEGARTITATDIRWGRCDIKSLNLLPNILAKQRAFESGAFEAIFIRSGAGGGTGSHVTEGTSSNVFAVFGDAVVTPPQGPEILSGVTREMVLDLAKNEGFKAEERAITDRELLQADEVFLTGTTMEVLPVSRVDETVIGKGKPGTIAQQLHRRLLEAMRRH